MRIHGISATLLRAKSRTSGIERAGNRNVGEIARKVRGLPAIAAGEHAFFECRRVGKTPNIAGFAIAIVKVSLVNGVAAGMPMRSDQVTVALLNQTIGARAGHAS